jgi:hypothetical protein
MGGACDTHWEVENCIYGLVGKREGKIPRGRPRRKCDDNI